MNFIKNTKIEFSSRQVQFLSNNYALIEIGGNANTIQESMNTAKYLSEILDEVLKNMKR